MLGFFAMAALAGLAFGYNVFKIGIFILPFMAILFLSGMALGIFIAAAIFRLGPSVEMYRFFVRIYRFNLKTGGISRFSAEGV